MDRRHKLVRRYTVTDAARHDSQELDALLDDANTCSEVWADSAYRSAEIEASLAERGYKSRIHRRAARNRVLSKREQQGNTTRSRVRARVEHVFGHQATAMGGKLVRTIGLMRAKMKIGMQNLTYKYEPLCPSPNPGSNFAIGETSQVESVRHHATGSTRRRTRLVDISRS